MGERNAIAHFAHAPSGCYWYRIRHPMETLARQGIRTVQFSLNADIGGYDEVKSVQVYGIYPFSFEGVLKVFREDGKRIVYDLDDPMGLIDPTNPFYYTVRKDAASQDEMFRHADIVTVSTPRMAEYARKLTDRPVTVIPNCYDPREWNHARTAREGIRIGFAGSPTHLDDLNMVLPAIRRLQDKYGITFVLMGFGTGSMEDTMRQLRFVSSPEGLKAADEFEHLMRDIETEWVPNVDVSEYPRKLTELSLDIGICPLKSTPFNDCRSASKAMEYALSGALCLASDVEAYRNEPTSILVKDDAWYPALEYAISNPHIPSKIEHLEWIMRNRSADSPEMIDLLKGAYGV